MAEQPQQPRRGVLLGLAAEGVVPVLGGCAGALAGGVEGGVIGVAVGQAVEKAINFFGARIVGGWVGWFRTQPPQERERALAELASLPPEEARTQAAELIDRLALEPLDPADRAVAIDYLSLLPGALDRALPRDVANGGRSLPPTISFDEPQQLLGLLPVNLPPYRVGAEVPGTPYRLEALLGSGGFGAVYRASTRTLQHLPLAVKFCLDPALTVALHRERSNLERLMKAGGENWSPRIVRLYGYDLEHPTPYLVYEYVTGGDLIRHLAERREKLGHTEVFALITQVIEALAFAHESGLVHRDLKPANVLVEGGVLKLADFGLGGVAAARAAVVSRIGATTVDQLSHAEQATLFRGAGTPLYMAPEQRRGQAPDPRHDLYSLGVMWYQLLIGDVSRELHPGWAKELTVRHAVPRGQIELIERCVGWFDERPRHAGELLKFLREAPAEKAPTPAPTTEAPPLPVKAAETAVAQPAAGLREPLLLSLVKDLDKRHRDLAEAERKMGTYLAPALVTALVAFIILMAFAGWIALVAGPLLGGIVGGIVFLTALGRRAEVRERLAHTLATLLAEFPDVVRSWGGESVLRHPDTLARLCKQLGIEEPSAAPPATKPASGPEPVARRPIPVAVALIVGLLVGVPAGLGVGLMYAGYQAPLSTWGPNYVRMHYNHRMQTLTHAQYQRAVRQTATIAVTLGVLGGLFVGGLTAALLAWRRWYRRALVAGVAVAVILGCPAGIGVGIFHDNLSAPFTVYENYQMAYYDSRTMKIDLPRYELQSRETMTTSVTLGVLTGVLVLLVCVWRSQVIAHRQVTRATQEQGEPAGPLNATA